MRRASILLAVCSLWIVLTVAACDQGVNTPVENVLNPINTNAGHSINGMGGVTLDGSSTAEAVVSANQTPEGDVEGILELNIDRRGISGLPDNVETFQKVTCLKVEGNSAWIRSEIFKTSHPNEELFKVGTEYITLIRDFGDKGTDIMHPMSLKVCQSECGNPQATCSDKPSLSSMETVVSSGDYQVQ
ncbi:MAG: hypothetical protein WBW16_08120 [Bacteroidota bacterium]